MRGALVVNALKSRQLVFLPQKSNILRQIWNIKLIVIFMSWTNLWFIVPCLNHLCFRTTYRIRTRITPNTDTFHIVKRSAKLYIIWVVSHKSSQSLLQSYIWGSKGSLLKSINSGNSNLWFIIRQHWNLHRYTEEMLILMISFSHNFTNLITGRKRLSRYHNNVHLH